MKEMKRIHSKIDNVWHQYDVLAMVEYGMGTMFDWATYIELAD